MTRGRNEQLQKLYDLPLGETLELWPNGEDTASLLLKRLKQVTYRYLREGRAYRLTEHSDHVRAVRVAVGSHRKLSPIRDLKTGERLYIAEALSWKEKKALLAQLDRLYRDSNNLDGYWQAEVEQDGIYVRRICTGGEPLTWWERGNPEGRLLTLAR